MNNPFLRNIFRKKTIFLSVTAFILIISSSFIAKAQSYPWESGVKTDEYWKTAMQKTSGLNQWKWGRETFLVPMLSFITAFSPTGLPPDFSGSAKQSPLAWFEPGKPIVGFFSYPARIMAFMYETPATGNFNNYMASLGVIKQSQAAGSDVLSITLGIWRVIRNLCYVIFIIIFVVYGAMIMFRRKIDPRTVVTISNSIPNAVMAIVLITFSYAIAGFMYDLFASANNAVFNVMNSALYKPAGGVDLSSFGAGKFKCPYYSPPGDTGKYFPCKFQALDVLSVFGVHFGITTIFNSGTWTINLGSGPLGINSIEAGWLISFMLAMAVVNSAIKTLFALVSSYSKFFLNTITGPLVITMASIPGNSGSLIKWLKGFLSATLSFVAVFFAINMAYYILLLAKEEEVAHNVTQIQNLDMPALLGMNSPVTMATLLAYGILLILPAIPAAIDEALDNKESASFSRAVGDASSGLKKIPVIGGFLG